MINYNRRSINFISLIITIIIFLSINSINTKNSEIKINFINNKFHKTEQIQENTNKLKSKTSEIIKLEEEEIQKNLQNENWKLEIPSISLSAYIQEGTTKETMDKFIGHFEETSKENGNIGLAAHNRGYPINYFANLKKLKNGDKIIYKHDKFEQTYIVEKNIIIEDDNWDYLENTKENTITLITCVENEPTYRRCVQGTKND